MRPAPFEYFAPQSVEEAVALLDGLRGEEVKLLAGGQSLVPMMNLRLAQPTHLVDLNRIGDLSGITIADGEVLIGALTRHADIEDSPDLEQLLPILPAAAAAIGYRQIRNRGTIGGSCCHADPVAEWPMVTRLLDAEFDLVGPAGSRRVPADSFYVSVFTPDVAPDEVLTRIQLKIPTAPWGWGFSEFTRKAGDFAVIAAAAIVESDGRTVRRARIALAGVGSTPVRAHAAEAALSGAPIDDTAALTRAARLAADDVDPASDLHGGAEFRRTLTEVEVRRALTAATMRLGGPT